MSKPQKAEKYRKMQHMRNIEKEWEMRKMQKVRIIRKMQKTARMRRIQKMRAMRKAGGSLFNALPYKPCAGRKVMIERMAKAEFKFRTGEAYPMHSYLQRK